MTGDNKGDCKDIGTERVCWYYENSTPLPSSNLAISVGYFSQFEVEGVKLPSEHFSTTVCEHTPVCQMSHSTTVTLPCRLFAASSVISRAERCLATYLPRCIHAAVSLLGPLPFPRLDIYIVPQCFPNLGLTSPNLLFLSQSMLCEDESMWIRVAHEVSHYWFGLLIGARDWTEEWLSEGFATYMADSIHAKAMQWTEGQYRQQSSLRGVIRYHTLAAELSSTAENLQTLRPNCEEEACSPKYVKNGLNMEKMFMQVHYLKGYFLLRFLSEVVGVTEFDGFLKSYVQHFHGQMVLSHDFFNLLFEHFPSLSSSSVSMERIYKDWLDNPGIPKDLSMESLEKDNFLLTDVKKEFGKWKSINTSNKKRKSKTQRRKKQKIDVTEDAIKMTADQLVLLFEELLKLPALEQKTLEQLEACYSPNKCQADVCHRWCEIVVKHNYKKAYEDVKNFLIHHQAMGVYLYGELVISRSADQRRLAEECFKTTGPHMELATHKTVYAMLYGTKDT